MREGDWRERGGRTGSKGEEGRGERKFFEVLAAKIRDGGNYLLILPLGRRRTGRERSALIYSHKEAKELKNHYRRR